MSKLKLIRESKNLSQSKLAELSGASLRTIQHYEQGSKDINKAQVNILLKLSQVLECSIEDLLES